MHLSHNSNSTTEASDTQDKEPGKTTNMVDQQHQKDYDEEEEIKITAPESSSGDRAVCWSRTLVFAVIAIAATVIGTCTYQVIHREEVEDFQNKVSERGPLVSVEKTQQHCLLTPFQFRNSAHEVIEEAEEDGIDRFFAIMKSLSEMATSFLQQENNVEEKG